jgi:6-phosphogluconolactonase
MRYTSGMDVEIVVAENADGAANAAAELLAETARSGGHVALAGGSTPRFAYELAAAAEPDWSRVETWLGDERCVPADDERANARLLREALLDRLAVPPRAAHYIRTELTAADAAAAYDAELRGVRLALAVLGLGPDGHTASLFPNAPSLSERERLAVVAAPGLAPWVERVTMTIPVLAGAHHVVFLAVGGDKAEAVHRAFAEQPSPATPASLIRSARGRTTAILDRAAATRLG